MIKHKIYLFALLALMLGACGCEKPKPTDEPQPAPKDTMVVEPEDMIWSSSKLCFNLPVENPDSVAAKVPVKVRITTDKKQLAVELTDTIEVAGKTEWNYVVTPTEPLAPGFYRANCYVNGKATRNFNFGIDPFDIVSAPDMQPDFDAFWQTAKDQLAAIDMQPNLIELPNKSSQSRKVYLVELRSVPDGLTGEPVVVRGYYCEPQDGQKHPVIMHFYGYDTQGTKAKVECPSGASSTYAEFYLSHRGQYINNRPASSREEDGLGDLENSYGDWFAWHFGDKDSYYYRGAFMDCVQAVRFMATRPTSDMEKLFGEGSSQGGALSYACAALSDYPFKAIAPNVAFLGDFPDYFQIVGWPAEVAKKEAKKQGMTDEQMYAFLSYFDTKNLAPRISCAVLGSSGLQDGTCPPHTNIAPFNNLKTAAADKEYVFVAKMGHDYPPGWSNRILAFFKERM